MHSFSPHQRLELPIVVMVVANHAKSLHLLDLRRLANQAVLRVFLVLILDLVHQLLLQFLVLKVDQIVMLFELHLFIYGGLEVIAVVHDGTRLSLPRFEGLPHRVAVFHHIEDFGKHPLLHLSVVLGFLVLDILL